MTEISLFRFELLEHLAYSSNLAQIDFLVFKVPTDGSQVLFQEWTNAVHRAMSYLYLSRDRACRLRANIL